MLEEISFDFRDDMLTFFKKLLYTIPQKDLKNKQGQIIIKSMQLDGIPILGNIRMIAPLRIVERTFGNNTARKYLELNPHFYIEQEELEKEQDELTNEKRRVKGYFRRLFLAAETYGDFKLLLPESLHDYLPKDKKQLIYNSAAQLPYEFKRRFDYEEQDIITEIKERLMLNILLGGSKGLQV